jgi:predicted MFS family arabinose efflux permease
MAPPSESSPVTTKWLAVTVLFCAGLVAAMQFAKVAPVMGDVSGALGLNPVMAGLAVSILGLVGILFAVTVGAVVAAIGLKRGLLIALFGGGAISLAGAFAPDAISFLLSRLLEGVSHLFIVVCAPALMAAVASPKDRPVALSIWGCFFGLGFAIVSFAAPTLVGMSSWRGLMVMHGCLMLAVGVAVSIVMQGTAYSDEVKPFPRLASIVETHVAVFKSGAPLLLALTFMSYTILFLALLTFLTVYLDEVFKWSAERVGQFMALASFIPLVTTLFSGFLVRNGIGLFTGLSLAFAGLGVTSTIVFGIMPGVSVAVPAILLMMACFGLMPGFVFASVPSVGTTPQLAALTYSAIALFGNAGTFLGTPVFAWARELAGWWGGAVFVIIMCVAGTALAALVARMIARTEGHS